MPGNFHALFDPERQIVISDTHRGNFILLDNGPLAPIDLRVQPLSGSLLDAVTQLCSTHRITPESPRQPISGVRFSSSRMSIQEKAVPGKLKSFMFREWLF